MAAQRDASAVHAPARVRALYGSARMSPQRVVIAECVLDCHGTFTAEELHAAVLRRAHGIGLATVYRALSAMQQAHSITYLGMRNGSTLLARCDRTDHHHHLICNQCGDVVGFECPIDDTALTWPGGRGTVIRHEMTLYGLCPKCAEHSGGR